MAEQTNNELRIEAEEDGWEQPLRPGNTTPVVVQAVEEDDDDLAEELDQQQVVELGKPGRLEWVALHVPLTTTADGGTRPLMVRMLPHKKPGEFAEDYYYVMPGLRPKIAKELKLVRVVLVRELSGSGLKIWLVKCTPGNSYYESIAKVLNKSPEEIAATEYRIFTEKGLKYYRIKQRRAKRKVSWPDDENVLGMLQRALGEDGVIGSADHTIYDDLVGGEDV